MPIRRSTGSSFRRRCRIALVPAALQQVFDAIDPAKDVDGVTPVNVGRLVQNRADLVACTPSGIIELLKRSGIDIAGQARGRHRPQRHRRKAGLAASPASARDRDDLSLAHAGSAGDRGERRHPDCRARPPGIRAAIVRQAGGDRRRRRHQPRDRCRRGEGDFSRKAIRGARLFERKGSVLVGDVHPEVAEVAGAITPVPGGVGPLTIAMLMANTLKAAELRSSIVDRP